MFPVALVGTAIGITAYRLWSDRGKPTTSVLDPADYPSSPPPHPSSSSSSKPKQQKGPAWPVESRTSVDGEMGGQEGTAIYGQIKTDNADGGMDPAVKETSPPPPAYRERVRSTVLYDVILS
jgi:hypothetical protein